VNQDLDSSYSPKTSNEKPSQNSGRNEEIPEAMEEIHMGNDPTEQIYKRWKIRGDLRTSSALFLGSNGGEKGWVQVEGSYPFTSSPCPTPFSPIRGPRTVLEELLDLSRSFLSHRSAPVGLFPATISSNGTWYFLLSPTILV